MSHCEFSIRPNRLLLIVTPENSFLPKQNIHTDTLFSFTQHTQKGIVEGRKMSRYDREGDVSVHG